MTKRTIWSFIKNLINQSIKGFTKIFSILIQELVIKTNIFTNINNQIFKFLSKKDKCSKLMIFKKI